MGSTSRSVERRGQDDWVSAPIPILVMLVALGGLILVSSSNWLSVYLAIELSTLALFVLAAQQRGSGRSVEAGLKYFVLGALSSGLFLFGCALICGQVGGASISSGQLIYGVAKEGALPPLGCLLISVALLFKLATAPFHMWAPDVYDGAPTTTTALLAIVPKIAIFSILVSVGPLINMLLMGAVFSLIVGSLGALNQTKIKRLLAYSGIGHIGFILWGLEIGSFESIQASLIYMIIYVIMSISAFSIVLSQGINSNYIVEFSGLSRSEPALAVCLALTFLSMAGIPPLAGFIAKWLVLLSGVVLEYFVVAVLAVVCSVVAGIYYVRVVKIIYFQTDYPILLAVKTLRRENLINFRKGMLISISLFILVSLITSPNLLLQCAHWATVGLF
uniref:NADH:ubiquinone reductase (H(+)-translocating) n=1 Tax=Microzoanthus occultus TaxID=1130792 RepID=A0A6C0UAQ7_9CNID|nr:NADH dehydrogenase subunit 2 [Microzoanthus occultus]QIB71113.1 NADH dehydrogenase subunit 2 [Microzoanthus occultus]